MNNIFERNMQLNEIMDIMTDKLDIPETLYIKAKDHYNAVGKWLQDSNLLLFRSLENIYTQGSFSLGTMVKPINDEGYDIDLVCEFDMNKREVTPEVLKKQVGIRLKQHEKYSKMVTEGSRCWKVEYSDAEKFHIDILPAISEKDTVLLEKLGYTRDYSQFSINYTKKNYGYEWKDSNPKGYMEWFQHRMEVIYGMRKKALMEKYAYANIDDVPDYKVKTPLQRVIQILKRHRDILFKYDLDKKPSSICLTTLAAIYYKNENNVYDALKNIINQIRNDLSLQEDSIVILNPVNKNENFADKMNEDIDKIRSFRKWIKNLSTLLKNINESSGLDKVASKLEKSFGDSLMDETFTEYGLKKKDLRVKGELFVKPKTGKITKEEHDSLKIKKHNFYGD